MRENTMKIINETELSWTPPAIAGEIPHGDMPGDKVEIGESHIAKANAVFPRLLAELKAVIETDGKAVVAVSGGSGVGKSEIASLLTYYLNNIGIGSYTLSGDNYPRRIPLYNDAERLRIYRVSGIRGMLEAGVYNSEVIEPLKKMQLEETDADPENAAKYPWLADYQKAGRVGLAGYLGTANEQDFDELSAILARFKAGERKIWLKRMGRTDTELWYDEIDFSNICVLMIEWTHGNSGELQGVDIPILLNSTPEETREHRRQRGRDGKTDSAFTTTVLEIEQGKIADRAKSAKIIVAKSGEILTYEQYCRQMEG